MSMTTSDGNVSRQTKAEARRRQVLDAASECFRMHGFHSASMAQICKSAKMSAGHIYNFFTCKEEIIEAIVKEDLAETLKIINELHNSDEDFVDTMVSQLWRGVDRAMDLDNSALMLEVLAEAIRNPKVAQMVRQSDMVISGYVKALLRTSKKGVGQLEERDLNAITDLFSALFNGLMCCAVMNPDLDREAMTKLLRKVVGHILDPDESARP
ncbi:transcriptional regulator, TetR family [Desulfarculus baarsii DSM 2075]|uniref:Transcriptional regulator, TetR family n=1 Tax=Desulfarculus baarsii (strain ATCC 33931 / DSM 2075 / LMG 7858 / VKM B-1802 / 2st14) TaxID=644282 RepID=E1QHV6_DESB2|nr:TetR/AcrR family transcriptional regulator [Desulfarculus baarsii]ADK85149.1 transcriptional regulator, TetR family [Desulfarculus baarsii DSM 2075]